MALTWSTSAGSLGIITERITVTIPLDATTTTGNPITFSLISGNLPRGLRLVGNNIAGSPVEVIKFTTSRFVIRASDGVDLEDRTFSLSVDGSNIPMWVTNEGYLNVGPEQAYYVLDNALVDFQLEVEDQDIIAGDKLTFYLIPTGGQLPPGLTLSSDGRIYGYTDPIFAVEYNYFSTGSYDTFPFDNIPLDFVDAKSNGFDSYFYDDTTYDFSLTSRVPRHLSRIYTFAVAVTDGLNTVSRVFKIYVVTEEFLKSDNSLLQVDTNLFQADADSHRVPLWITESNLGRHRANNYLTIFLEVYHPVSLDSYLTYFLLPTNPDGSPSELPLGMSLDQLTGEVAGKVPYQARITKTYTFTIEAVAFGVADLSTGYNLRGDWSSTANYYVNDAVRYSGFIYIALQDSKNVPPDNTTVWYSSISTANKTFTIELIGEIESGISWNTSSDLGTIKPNQPSTISINATSLLYGGRVSYIFMSGTLPPGLALLPNGVIEGKVKQFADAQGTGLTRFFEVIGGVNDYAASWDGGTTTFDKKFTFTIKAQDSANFAELERTFSITVVAENTKTFANLYVKAFQSKAKRLDWFNFITDSNIFQTSDLYRYGDNNFSVQTELKMLVFAGIESTLAVSYVQAMSRNHYNKRIKFGNLNSAQAKDPITQEVIYEVVYVEMIDDYEKDGVSISSTVNLPDTISSPVLLSYNAIKVDSDIPLASDRDHQRIFPNSIKGMRNRIKAIGESDREFLPLWMRSIQDMASRETGYVKALVLCYAVPGRADAIINRIKAKIRDEGFDFKAFDFTADRYIIDVVNGEIQDKYLVFPQHKEKLP
jgi:hypothetical protein